jgi:hypothetical protein
LQNVLDTNHVTRHLNYWRGADPSRAISSTGRRRLTAGIPPQTDADKQYAAIRAACTAQIAAEATVSLDSLPPDKRHNAALWVGVLNACAKDIAQNGIPARPADLSRVA